MLYDCDGDVNILCNNITATLYRTSIGSRVIKTVRPENAVLCKNSTDRWKHILDSHDPKYFLQAANFSGSFGIPGDVQNTPSNQQFCDHI